jgi:lipopolysaccharide transport system ATP-binding protein
VAETIIKVENLSKRYKLGTIGTGTLSHDLKRWWQRKRGKEDEYLRMDESQAGGEYWALKGVDFDIKAGDAVGIIGRNGAGKSTLLKILSRVTAPTRGGVKIGGRLASLLEVGTGFHPELTGRENIFMNGAIMGMTKAEIRGKIDEIIDFSGVEQYIDTPVKRYSSGMYVRLAFAVAAHLESEILIVDEVLAVGDAEFQKKCLGKMGDVSKNEGRTVLFVSHHLSTVKDLCNTGIILNKGRVDYMGSSNEAVNQFLASFRRNTLFERNNKHELQGIIDCKLLSDFGGDIEIQELIADQPLNLSFEVKGYQKRIDNVSIGMRIMDESNTVLSTSFSDYYGQRFNLEPGETVQVKVNNSGIYLAPGLYTLSVELWSDIKQLPSSIESIQINVIPSDIFKKGFGLIKTNKEHGPLLWESDWKIEK